MLTALHGFTETDDVWTEVLEPLKRPVRCPLLPGHGWKPCPAGTTITSVATEIAAKLPANGDLLGYSLGGRIALQLALDHPTKLRRLVLISSTAGLRDAKERVKRVRHDHAFELIAVLADVRQIRGEEFDARVVHIGELNPAIDQHHLAVPLQNHAVHADFA